MDVEKLARMANQIAANFSYGAEKTKEAAGVADHLRRFWSPSMRVALVDAHRRNAVDLTELAALALEELPESKPTAAA
jgi:formate dehydrogenase subunit delta